MTFEVENATKLYMALQLLTKHLKKMRKLFSLDLLNKMFLDRKITATQMSTLRHLWDYKNEKRIGNLIYCGAYYRIAFPAGMSPFNSDQTVWLNELEHISFSILCILNGITLGKKKGQKNESKKDTH